MNIVKKLQGHPVVFVAGIDTDIGKTVCTGLLARELGRRGVGVITQKLVQTGCEGIAADILEHRKIQGVGLYPEDLTGTTCRYVYPYPCSPHMAADLAQEEIQVEIITQDTQILLERYEMVLLEAAGGLAVPITQDLTILDYIARQAYPLVLVSGGKLGSINHTVLSLKACKQKNIPVLALLYNRYPLQDVLITRNTEEYLRNYLQSHHPQAEFCVVEQVHY